MTRQDFTPEQINAYVDGELPPALAAKVADAAAVNDQLSRQIAALTHMKHAVIAGIPDRPTRASQAPARRRRLAAIAAVLIATACLSLAAITFDVRSDQDTETWPAIALRTHEALSSGPAKPDSDPALILAALPRLGASAFVPDLTAARLRVSGISEVEGLAGGHAVAIGYYGTRGCRLTVLMTDADLGLDDRMRKLARLSVQAYGWRMGGLSYLVMASRMAPKRLATIAGSIHWSSVRAAKPDKDIRTALQQSRRNSPPCARA